MLLAGDIFDRGVAFAETEEALSAAIAECAVPVVISPGNHDYYALGGRWDRLRLPENAHIFKRAELEGIELPELGARVYGAAFTDRYCPPLLRGFHAPREEGHIEHNVRPRRGGRAGLALQRPSTRPT